LFGSRNDYEGVKRTDRYRSINREKFCRDDLEAALADPDSQRAQVFRAYRHMLQVRAQHPAFHPNGPQQILEIHAAVFAVLRTAPDGSERMLCLNHVSEAVHTVHVDVPFVQAHAVHDVLTGETFSLEDGKIVLELAPYRVLWLKEVDA
jgi:sucrose phosphorylase